MKRICLKCNRTSIDGNLWCQEKYCPAEDAPIIYDRGEWIGNIEIVELFTVMHSCAIYEARRNGKPILLKIAHEGYEEKLKREARLFVELSLRGQHPMLPVILPAHEQASVRIFPYGKVVVADKVKYYEVFSYVRGDLLRNLLLKNSQPWYQHVGWFVLSLADVIALLHANKKLHLSLSPDVILIREDKEGIPRPLLLDLGVAEDANQVINSWDKRFAIPAYTAPEMIEMNGKIGAATDVYGLGMILYEMLSGRPAFDYKIQKDDVMYHEVLTTRIAPTGRTDLKNIPGIAERAISKDYDSRHRTVMEFARELQANFPPVPKEKKEFRINWRMVGIVIGSLLAVSLLMVLAII
jgi:serine/threonine protein kinase